MKKTILVTSALPYANGPLHFGHIAGSYLPADVFVRFQRLCNNDVVYICGSDEYGIAVSLSAKKAGKNPKEHVDYYHDLFQRYFKLFNIVFDNYSRTSAKIHRELAQEFFLRLLENGFVEKRVCDQLYSQDEKMFLADRYVVGTCPKCGYENARGDECTRCGASYEAIDLLDPRSALSGTKAEIRSTEHWFLKLEVFKDGLQKWLATKKWKANTINFTKNFIDDVKARAITRDSSWGVDVPLKDAEGKVLYVWFDAPIGYISSTKEWAAKTYGEDKEYLWKSLWMKESTRIVNFMGKDNIPFHSVIFPAMLMGQRKGYRLVDDLVANEFYTLQGRQFSKSDNWYIDIEEFFEKFSADQIRYTIAATAPETCDSEFSWEIFQNKNNVDLVDKFGNFVNRVIKFCEKYIGPVPMRKIDISDEDKEFLCSIREESNRCKKCYEEFSLRKASGVFMKIAQMGNVYFDKKQPWKIKDNVHKRRQLINTIACCVECIKIMALTSFPIMPETANKMWKMIGFDGKLESRRWKEIVKKEIDGNELSANNKILFNKIEDCVIEEEVSKLKKDS